jgi:hypothetical protein
MRFEFDGAKSAANKVKHGIDVVEAQALWNVVGQIGETIWTATVTAEEFDRLAESGVDMTPYVDWSKARRPGREVQRVNVDFPIDLLKAIDQEAKRIGVTRQAFIKLRLADTLENH